jgi:hypothetical protein
MLRSRWFLCEFFLTFTRLSSRLCSVCHHCSLVIQIKTDFQGWRTLMVKGGRLLLLPARKNDVVRMFSHEEEKASRDCSESAGSLAISIPDWPMDACKAKQQQY